MRNSGSRRCSRLLQHSGQSDFETTKFHCSGRGQLLEFPAAGSCLPPEGHRQPLHQGRQLVWDGESKDGIKAWHWTLEPEWNRYTAGASQLGHGQVRSGKAREVFPPWKHCHRTTGLRGFACIQTMLFQSAQHISRTQGKTGNHEVMNSLGHGPWLGHCLPKLLPAPGENSLGKAGKSTRSHSAAGWPVKENPVQHKEREGGCVHSFLPEQAPLRTGIFCWCSQWDDTSTCLRPNILLWATGSERKCHWNSGTL